MNADPARRLAPPPACVLPVRAKGPAGFMPSYTDADYWKLVFPEFDGKSDHLPDGARACTGADVFDGPMFRGATPRAIETNSIVYGGGSNRIRILWLRSHRFPDGRDGGALTLIRIQEGFAEVYAVGSYRGAPDKTRLGLERMGRELVVSAMDEGCTGHAPGTECDSMLSLYVPWAGSLELLAHIAVERVRYASDAEPGVSGKVEYSLLSALKFENTGIRVLEQVVAKSEDGRELRKAERERVLSFERGKLVPSEESIWPRIFVAESSKKADDERVPGEP
jgi:hypothetical protein